MVSIFVRVDKVVIGLMFWNFIGMLLNMFLGYLEVAAKIMQYKLVLFIVTLRRCWNFVLDQISFWDEVAASALTMQLVEQVIAEVWTKVEYVLNHHRGTLEVQEVVYTKFCNSINGVVFLFDHIRCALGIGSVEHFPVALLSILSNIDYHLLNQYQYKVCKHVLQFHISYNQWCICNF